MTGEFREASGGPWWLAVALAVLCARGHAGERPYPFAMCSNPSVLTNPTYPVKMLDAGARMCRVDVTFPNVRRQPGADPATWDFTKLNRIRQLRKEHPQLEFLVLLGYGSPWAQDPRYASVPGKIGSPQRGIEVMPVSDPRNLYGHYVYETVRRYKDVTKTWESWNEPDLAGHHYFKGNGADFFAYQKACYLAAKAADPECTVLFAGMCYRNVEGYLAAHKLPSPSPSPAGKSFFEEYLQRCLKDPNAKRHGYYFDVMNQHTYSRASDAYDYVMVVRKLMRDYLGMDKPVWITEMGMTDKGGVFGGTPEEYCDYVLQSYAWAALAGVQRLFHFQLDNSNGHGLYRGMLGEPKPVLTTYRDVLVHEFADAKLVAQLHGTRGVGFLEGHSPYKPDWKAGYDLFEFRSRDGARRILMGFADTARAVTVKVPAKADQATLINRHNKRTALQAKDGAYTLTLPGATNRTGWPTANEKTRAMGQPEHLVGGATYVIVEKLR